MRAGSERSGRDDGSRDCAADHGSLIGNADFLSCYVDTTPSPQVLSTGTTPKLSDQDQREHRRSCRTSTTNR